MPSKLIKIAKISVLLLLLLHFFVAVYSYFVPGIFVLVLLAAVIIFLKIKKFSTDGIALETLFAACVINIPFGAGGYLYLPWTGPAALVLCGIFAIVQHVLKKPWWPSFRWSFIAFVTLGFFLSVVMRSDAGFRKCNPSFFNSSKNPARLIFSYQNPYGIYVSPGGCPVISCQSMSRSIQVRDCSGSPEAHDMPGNPQRMAVDSARNRIYFPIRGTDKLVIASIKPFAILKTVEVPGTASLLNAEVIQADGRLAIVDERRHSLFVWNPRNYSVERSVPLGWGASYSVAIDQKNNFAYVADWAGAFLHKVNLAGGAATKRYVGLSSFVIKTDSLAGLIYVARPLRGKVAVLRTGTLDVIKLFDAGYGVRDIALDPGRNRIVCGNYFDGTVDVLRLTDGKELAHYKAGPLVRGVAIDEKTGDIYISWTCGVSVIPEKKQ